MEDEYIRQINTLATPSFPQICQIAKENCGCVCHGNIDNCKPWLDLDHGVALLDTHEKLCKYLCAYGEMHEEKMKTSFAAIPNPQDIFYQDITIIDWGCGQGLATICFFDYLNQKNIENKTEEVILIEPSEKALSRAKLHVNAYLKDENKIQTVNKYLDDVTDNDIITDTPVVLHFFSNILDIKEIDLKKLAQKVGNNETCEQYLFCVSPLVPNGGSRRIDAFYRYFNQPNETVEYENSQFGTGGRRTLKLLIFKLEAGKVNLIQIEYYPPVQFHAGYQLDCVKQVVKTLSDEEKQKYNLTTAFEVAAPFDIGASIYDDVQPIFAVLNNIVTRGLPTRTSPFIEQIFEKFGNQRIKDDLGSIKFQNDKFQTNNWLSSVEYLTPIAVARVQKTILEALMTDKISINEKEWNVLITERDVPCAAIAFEDLRQMFNHLTALSKDYTEMKFPKVNLEIISIKEYINSPLHLNIKPSAKSNTQQHFKEYDMVIDISVLQQSDIKNVSFSEFRCKNSCYFNVRSAKQKRTVRHIYTSDTIEYRPLVLKDTQGNYKDIAETQEHLVYFLQLLFRKEKFRPGQLPILDRALQNKSVIGLLPTGGGKSLTYQLAAMLQPGVTIVIDPLRSLMKDQYDGLINNGIDTCAFINSTLSSQEKEKREKQMESSQMQFVFLSPERLCIYRFRERLRTMRDLHVYFAYGVIDEVHCVSEWGHDFRFSYLHLGRNLYNYVYTKNQKKHLTLFGLTATASFDVLADVERELSGNGAFSLDADTIIRYENTNRLELQYKVEKISVVYKKDVYRTKNEQISNYITQIPDLIAELQTQESIQYIKEKFIERENIDAQNNTLEIENIITANIQTVLPKNWIDTNQPYKQGGIVFCPHREGLLGVKGDRGISKAIKQNLPCNDVGTFVGGDQMRDQDRFINNELPIMVATKAFGMGIDKPNVRFTINVNHSSSLEGFVQEAGRAGRDRKMALSTILYSDFTDIDKEVMMYFFNNTFKGEAHEKQVMNELLSRKSIHYFIPKDELVEIQKTNNVCGFLTPLFNAQLNQNVVSFISYIDDKDYNERDKSDYIEKAIYRMCCIELIDDFTQDYSNNRFRIVTKRKADGEYYQGLKRFLMRYYSADRAEEEIQKVPHYKGENEIHKCLGYLTEFIYDKIAVKRKRAIDDMRAFCIQGIDESKDWK
jgi:ATP-dependent DNA helicase RecQ